MFDIDDSGPDYQLVWPRDLFASELRAAINSKGLPGAIELVLHEAFVGSSPVDDLNQVGWNDLPETMQGMWDGGNGSPQRAFAETLLNHAGRLLLFEAPQPYWAAGHGHRHDHAESAASPKKLREEWVELALRMQSDGYLEKVAPRRCVDDRQDADDADVVLEHEIVRRLGVTGLWPPSGSHAGWDDDTFFGLIEVFHDLMARPRSRLFHDFAGCGYHYTNFAFRPGRALYRSSVNSLLKQHDAGLELAADGEDEGRLVHAPNDPRQDLFARAASVIPSAETDSIQHAIALYRARGATTNDKRSACITLAGVLEARRDQIKLELLSKDEGALFHIANQFAIRHQNADQKSDYAPAYLDWIFWWYLATIDLVASITRSDEGAPRAPSAADDR